MPEKKTQRFKESVGIDIGSHSVKIVHLKKHNDAYKLQNFAMRSTIPEHTDYQLSELRKERYAPVISEMMKSLKINPRKIKHLVTAIGGEQVSIKQIKTIFLPDDELESALFFEAKKHLAISGGEMQLDFQVLSIEEKTNQLNVLLVATTKEYLRGHTDILVQSGLTPHFVDAEVLAVANSFILNTDIDEGVYILLNIGAHKTNMVVYGTKTKFFSREIDLGGYHFTRDLMLKQNLSFEEAEKYKCQFGLETQSSSSSISLEVSEKPTEENLSTEVKRSLRYYVKEAGNSDFRKILLTGGSAKLKGLKEYLETHLSLPVEIFNPFNNIEISERTARINDPQLAVAVGLAMRSE